MAEPARPMNPAEDSPPATLRLTPREDPRAGPSLPRARGELPRRSRRREPGRQDLHCLVKALQALQFLIDRYRHTLPQRHQRIACITFTNVAKDEIEARTDRSPLIHCNTIHAFCWSLIVGFQRQLRERLPELEHWPERLAEAGDLGDRPVAYELGHRGINDARISIHHDDVLFLTIDSHGTFQVPAHPRRTGIRLS